MADQVVTQIKGTEPLRRLVHLACVSDGTGETNVVKVQKSSLSVFNPSTGVNAAPTSIEIQSVRWNVQGFTSVRLQWAHTVNDLALALAGSGYEDFNNRGPITDPRSAGGTGDIVLTSAGALAGATYDITLELLLTP